jgi:hypothetical protein
MALTVCKISGDKPLRGQTSFSVELHDTDQHVKLFRLQSGRNPARKPDLLPGCAIAYTYYIPQVGEDAGLHAARS